MHGPGCRLPLSDLRSLPSPKNWQQQARMGPRLPKDWEKQAIKIPPHFLSALDPTSPEKREALLWPEPGVLPCLQALAPINLGLAAPLPLLEAAASAWKKTLSPPARCGREERQREPGAPSLAGHSTRPRSRKKRGQERLPRKPRAPSPPAPANHSQQSFAPLGRPPPHVATRFLYNIWCACGPAPVSIGQRAQGVFGGTVSTSSSTQTSAEVTLGRFK